MGKRNLIRTLAIMAALTLFSILGGDFEKDPVRAAVGLVITFVIVFLLNFMWDHLFRKDKK